MSSSDLNVTHEEKRLLALKAYQIFDTLSEAEYDDLTELASDIIGAPISLISLIDENRQWFKSKKGISISETDRSFSFCAHAIQNKVDAFIIEDARDDYRFSNNPYVTGDPNIVFYAGIPLIDGNDFALGTLCIIDNKPRKLNEKQLKSLRTIAKQVVRLIESRKTHRELGDDKALLTEALGVNNGFYLILDKDAKIVSFGDNFKNTLNATDDALNFYDYFEFEGAFNFEKYRSNDVEYDQKLKFFKVKEKHQRFKCSLKKIKDTIIIVASPVINSEYTLKDYNLTLNDFAPHDYIAEYLFLQQSTQRSLKDTQSLTTKLIDRNKELEKAQLNINALSRFPDENPNPVLRFDFDYHLVYSNESSRKFFLNDFGISQNDIEDISFKLLLSEMIGPTNRFEQRILERNNRHYSITLKTVSEFKYINLYVNEITSFIERVRSNELALIEIKDQVNEQREFYEFILNNIPADIAVFSKEHKYVYINPQGIKNTELRKFMIGKDDFDYCRFKGIPDDMAHKRRGVFNSILENKEFINWEDDIKDAEGNRAVVYRRMGPLFNANGEIEYIIGYGVNITDRKIAEENLISANNRLNLLEKFINNTNDSIQVSNEAGQLIYINKKASERLGIDPKSITEYSVMDFEETINDDEKWKNHLEVLKSKQSLTIEGINKNLKTNELIDVEVNLNYEVIDGEGYIIGASRDVTERRRAQEEINRLSLVAKNTNNGVLILDTERKITWANDAMFKRSGYTLAELAGNSPRVFQFEKTDKTVVEKIYHSLLNLESVSEELLHISKGGNEYWIDLNIMPINDNDGNHIGFIAIEFDITERKRFEETIAEQNKNLREITDALNESSLVSVTDTKGIIFNANKKFCEISGYTEKELIGKPHNIVNSNYHSKAFWADVWQTISSGMVWQGEIKNKAKNGSYYWVNSVIYPIRDLNGKLIRYLSIHHEITAKKESEEREAQLNAELVAQQHALVEISQLSNDLDTSDKFNLILEIVTETLNCESACIWFHISEETKFVENCNFNKTSQIITSGREISKETNTKYFELLKQREAFLISNDCEKDDLLAELYQNHFEPKRIKSIIHVPIRISAEIYGFVSIEHIETTRTWQESELNFAQSISNAIALVIENAKKEEAQKVLEGKANFQNLLMEISTKYINLSNDEVNDAIVKSLQDIGQYVGMDRVYVFEYDFVHETANCTFEWCRKGISSQKLVRQNISLDSIPLWVIPHSKGEAFQIDDTSKIVDIDLKSRLESREIKSLITIPLMNGKDCLGFVGFNAVSSVKLLNTDEQSLLELYAQMLVNVKVRSNYIDQIQDSKQEIERINESLEQRVIEQTQKNVTLAKTLSDQEKLVTLGEISSGIAHDLNTPLGAIKSGAESIRYTLENLFKETITKCSEYQINVACQKAITNDSELFVGGLQFIRETRDFENFLEDNFPEVESSILKECAEKFVKARIPNTEIELIRDVFSGPNPLEYLDLIYQLKTVRTFIDTILKSSEKAARVIQDLRSFIKDPKNKNKGRINLRQNISTVLNIFNFELKKTADVEFEVHEHIEVEAFDIKLFQLWSNLIKNAIEAMEENKERGVLKIYSHIEQNIINIVVENNGPKIPEEIQNEIFNKFYTTKSSKNGTGLGLNIVKNIIEDHDAKIDLVSREGCTKFIITFNKPE
jgi:PAS domain S-box-containing protein